MGKSYNNDILDKHVIPTHLPIYLPAGHLRGLKENYEANTHCKIMAKTNVRTIYHYIICATL